MVSEDSIDGRRTENQPHVSVRRVQTLEEMIECLRIRLTVFVSEQLVPLEEEVDPYDSSARHYLATLGTRPVATARLVELSSDMAKIGRVAVLARYRRQGIGSALMRFLMAEGAGYRTLVLDSQVQAAKFYERWGFVAVGETFIDAGIPHVRMVRAQK